MIKIQYTLSMYKVHVSAEIQEDCSLNQNKLQPFIMKIYLRNCISLLGMNKKI